MVSASPRLVGAAFENVTDESKFAAESRRLIGLHMPLARSFNNWRRAAEPRRALSLRSDRVAGRRVGGPLRHRERSGGSDPDRHEHGRRNRRRVWSRSWRLSFADQRPARLRRSLALPVDQRGIGGDGLPHGGSRTGDGIAAKIDRHARKVAPRTALRKCRRALGVSRAAPNVENGRWAGAAPSPRPPIVAIQTNARASA